MHNDPVIITACCCCGDCRCPINIVQTIEDFSVVAWLYMIFGQVSGHWGPSVAAVKVGISALTTYK